LSILKIDVQLSIKIEKHFALFVCQHSKQILAKQNLQCTDDGNKSYRNICNMSLISFSLVVIFIIRLLSTSAFVYQRFWLLSNF